MSIYVFSLLVGYLPNGVDNAQGYRAGILEKFSSSIRYFFTELPTRRYVNRYTKAGIKVGQMRSIHQYFTDNHSLELSGKVKDKLKELRESLGYTAVEPREKEIALWKDGTRIASVLLEREDGECFYGIHYYNHGKLIRTEYYTNGISYVDYYVTAVGDDGPCAKRVRRTFYNRDGAVAYDQIMEGVKEWYLFPDGRLCTKSELMGEFVKRLQLTERDIVLLDRSAQFDFVQPLFQFGGNARFIAVLHSGHFFEKGEDPNVLYLNYEYYYWFKYANMIDTMVVSTQEQKEDLVKKLREYHCCVPDIAVIPAGGIERLRYPEGERHPYSLLSVSRIDPRKKIEWIIRSVIKAHEREPRIFLDIYGRGEERYTQYLQDMVSSNYAQSYIRFMGQRNVTEVYKNYEVFVSASLWETLGLSVMEAVGSGTAVIGLDVRYGNRLFIHPGENGYLVDFDLGYVDGEDERLVEDMAEKIVKIFEDRKRLEEFHQKSYEIGKDFMQDGIAEKWGRLLELL